MSERVREEHPEARLELIGEEENIPFINPSGNESSNPAGMQLPEKPPSAQEGSMSTTQEGGAPVELDEADFDFAARNG